MKKRVISVLLVIAFFFGCFPTVALAVERDTAVEEVLAENLKELGLFKGVSDTDFALRRAPDRTEALVMLIRILGKENEAMNGRWTHPFTDVPSWADKFVGYAYQTGLTNGVNETQFGGSMTAGSYMYLTFVLRALGYSDADGLDFAWDNPYDLAQKIGILPQGTNVADFWRADVVRVSYAALPVKLKGSDKALYEKLIEAGTFSLEQYNAVYDSAALQGNVESGQVALSAEQISVKCAPAVFYIDIYAMNGALAGSGSGFFISADGIAITNYHVAANSSQLVITTKDGNTYSDVKIIDRDLKNDLALLKVTGSDFPYLDLADSSQIVQGQKVYAIGSPRGLENTMSEGMISNSKRLLDGKEYIQISVPIAPGSSGGALINEQGKVVGVTSAGFANSTGDLNLAIPSNCIGALDKTSNSDFILWQRKFYPGFEHVYDFGEFSGVKLLSAVETPLGYKLTYDAFDFHDIGNQEASDRYAQTLYCYCQALLEEGFVQLENENELLGHFDGPTESVYISADLAGAGTITVLAELLPQYYTEIPLLPDLGWYIGIESGDAYAIDESLMYSYKWTNLYDSSNFQNVLEWYYELLEDEGFDRVHVDSTSALFEGNGLSIVYMIDETMIYVDVAPLSDGGTIMAPSFEEILSTSPTISDSVGAYVYPLHLYSNDGKVYLGKLTTDKYDFDSIWNEYGDYGSKYATNSIWNQYGDYGSKYSSKSAFNEYASTPPKIVDNNGKFFGYLTANKYKADGYTIIEITQHLTNQNQ